ncbi:P-loop NTPase family protein [Pontiella sulfatireligans]|uniref:Uncharacterized protein n=1 Tax=Pontiella sulfatireligans TaxID=2750658 RepID=A0A6C2UTU0_9BACT|nr:hypothetical protein [Pontiella sulfatireligans]VGO22711.1 hypothetical protein SCARR_04807 [Pontiella sulfatireligans]
MNHGAYIESLNQLAPFKSRYPDGIETFGTWGDGITDPDECNFPMPFLAPLDLSQSIDWKAVQCVAQWMIDRETGNAKPWGVFHGATGLGKSRASIVAGFGSVNGCSSALFSDFTHFRFVRAVEFARLARMPHGKPLEFTAFKNPDYKDSDDPEYYFDGLILDDLDKASFSANVVAELFDLIDHAEQTERLLIINTQATGGDLAKMMLGSNPDPQRTARVQSIMRRLIDHAKFIHFQK